MPEALIIQRYKYDLQKRIEYYGDKHTPYDDVDDATGNITDNWWREFNSLNHTQREQAEQLIISHHFSNSDIDVYDEKVKSLLRYYQIKRDDK